MYDETSENIAISPVVQEPEESAGGDPPRPKKHFLSHSLIILLLLLLLGIIVALVTVLVLVNKDSSSDDDVVTMPPSSTSPETLLPTTDEPSTAPPTTLPSETVTPTTVSTTTDPSTINPKEELKNLLALNASFDLGVALEDTTSPQYAAFTWLAADINLHSIEYSNEEKIQRYVLATLFYSMGGPGWYDSKRRAAPAENGWLSSEDECEWLESTDGNACDNQGRVVNLILSDNNLKGAIPSELGFLSNSLKLIDLHGNEIVGHIPTSLSLLTELQSLDLNNNKIDGNIPTEFGNMISIEYLDLSFNPLSGNVPNDLGQLTKMEYFDIRGTSLEGKVPTDICAISAIQNILVDCDKLDCKCCDGCLFDFLSSVAFDSGTALHDQDSAQYAAFWFLESDDKLWQYSDERLILRFALATLYHSTEGDNWTDRGNWLSRDNHECDWSQHIVCSGSDVNLLLTRNNLHGTIPDELGLLSNNLKELYLDRNALHSKLPKTLAMLTQLKRLLVCVNDITGPIPNEFGSLTNLDVFDLGDNILNGIIPSELGKLTHVNTLRLERNSLGGGIPTELGMMTELRFLNLTDNTLIGTIPNQLEKLKRLKRLHLRGNHLSGRLPRGICKLPNIEEVVLECSHYCPCCVSCASDDFTCIDDPPFAATGSDDIGPVRSKGSSEECGSHCYSVLQGGYSGNYVSDDFSDIYHFTYQPLSSMHFRFTAEVCGYGCSWGSDESVCGNMGLMIRESLDEDAVAVFANHQPNLYASMISRAHTEGLKTINTQFFQIDSECLWINLIRKGSTFTFSCSRYVGYAEGKCDYRELEEGDTCYGSDSLGEVQIDMPRNVLVGLAVSGHRPLPGFGRAGESVAEFHYIELDNLESDLKDFLISASWDNGESLQDYESPQFKAFQWLQNDPNLDLLSNPRRLQRYALATFWYSTNGASWQHTDWFDYHFMSYSQNECLWAHGMSCTNGLIKILDLALFNPDGTIPLEIGLLSPELRKLSFRESSLKGRIPTTIGMLTKLEILDLSFNDLTQNLPLHLGSLANLKVLSLGRNNLDGTIPTEMGKMVNLHTIGLEQNSISGEIPAELGQMKELRYLHLDDNRLTGAVPKELAKLEKLKKLTIHENEIEGYMPTEICDIASLELVKVDCDEVLSCSCCALCETIDQCFEVSSQGYSCQVRMLDNLNDNDVVLEALSYGNNSFLITDRFEDEGDQWAVPMMLTDAGDLMIDAGVPQVTCDDILKDRVMKDDSQLTFLDIPGHPCTPFGKNIIYFMIMEWFYFGR